MTDAYVYDTVRTPRGRGKKDGALHEVTALELGTQVLRALRDRNNLDTSRVDDVIFGCVDPVGEQGGDIARIAVLNADYAQTVAGVQINRFCASGLEATNMAAAKVMSGEADMAIGGGVESMSRIGMGASGGAWSSDPHVAFRSYFTPQGIGADLVATKYGFSRADVDAYAVESQKRAANAWKNGYFKNSVVPVKDINGLTILDHDEHMRPDATMQSLGSLAASFQGLGEFAFDGVALDRYPEVEEIIHVHHAGNSSGIVDRGGLARTLKAPTWKSSSRTSVRRSRCSWRTGADLRIGVRRCAEHPGCLTVGSVLVLKPREVVALLEAHGFSEVRQRGSHKEFRHPDGRCTTVPFHSGRRHLSFPPAKERGGRAPPAIDEFLALR